MEKIRTLYSRIIDSLYSPYEEIIIRTCDLVEKVLVPKDEIQRKEKEKNREIIDINSHFKSLIIDNINHLEYYINWDDLSLCADFYIAKIIKIKKVAQEHPYFNTKKNDEKLEILIIPAFKKEIDYLIKEIKNPWELKKEEIEIKKSQLFEAISNWKIRAGLIHDETLVNKFMLYLDESMKYTK
jgi:hypothetical protein